MSLKDQVDHVLRFEHRPAPYHFSSSRDGGDGWTLEETGSDVVHVRWNWRDPRRRDHELRTELLKPVAAFLSLHRFPVTWQQDQLGPYLRVTR
jgi:hypothetical protein